MRKVLVAGAFLLVLFAVTFRQRIYVRDPLGKVERDGVTQDSARLYINYSNDVLLEDPAQHRFVLVQGWSRLPGVPQHLFCLTGLMCLTDADHATVDRVEGPGGKTQAAMSGKEVTFIDEFGVRVRVALR